MSHFDSTQRASQGGGSGSDYFASPPATPRNAPVGGFGPPGAPPDGFASAPPAMGIYPGAPAGYFPGYPPPARPGLPTAAKVAIGVGVAVAGLVVVGILAAIAIPVFLNQRLKANAATAAATTVTIPDRVAGLTRMTDARSAALEKQVVEGTSTGVVSMQAGVYGTSGRRVAVITVGKHPFYSGGAQRSYMRAAEGVEARSLGTAGTSPGTVFRDVDPGPLGGMMRCAPIASAGVTICVFVDPAAGGAIYLYGEPAQAAATALRIRAGVELRAP